MIFGIPGVLTKYGSIFEKSHLPTINRNVNSFQYSLITLAD